MGQGISIENLPRILGFEVFSYIVAGRNGVEIRGAWIRAVWFSTKELKWSDFVLGYQGGSEVADIRSVVLELQKRKINK